MKQRAQVVHVFGWVIFPWLPCRPGDTCGREEESHNCSDCHSLLRPLDRRRTITREGDLGMVATGRMQASILSAATACLIGTLARFPLRPTSYSWLRGTVYYHHTEYFRATNQPVTTKVQPQSLRMTTTRRASGCPQRLAYPKLRLKTTALKDTHVLLFLLVYHQAQFTSLLATAWTVQTVQN